MSQFRDVAGATKHGILLFAFRKVGTICRLLFPVDLAPLVSRRLSDRFFLDVASPLCSSLFLPQMRHRHTRIAMRRLLATQKSAARDFKSCLCLCDAMFTVHDRVHDRATLLPG